MTGDTWIKNGYEGEVSRCLPGSTLKVMLGSVVQSEQGMSTSLKNASVLTCGAGEALRHYKDGMLKCAPAVKVVDCTERTNLRKWGTADMFFSYVTKVCVEQKVSSNSSSQSSQSSSSQSSSSQSAEWKIAQAKSRQTLTLRGMTLTGGVGQGSGY